MRFMNDYDIDRAQRVYSPVTTPNRAYLADVVSDLAAWADRNSDGWCYWPKPARAAQGAIALIESTTNAENEYRMDHDASDADTTRAVSTIKSFLTRQGVSPADVLPPRPVRR